MCVRADESKRTKQLHFKTNEPPHLMNTPSNELHAMANEPKPNIEQVILEWVILLNKLSILHGQVFIYGVSEQLARKAYCMLLTEVESSHDNTAFEVMIMSHAQQIVSEEHVDNPIWSYFTRDGQAGIERSSNEDLDASIVPFIGFRGTWEEVARKLFELEKLMLAKAQVAEVPEDLKKQ